LQSRLKRIWSGGQTGADRAALDLAMEIGVTTGGFVPLGRMAEDGRIPARYPNLIETGSPDPSVRTRLNVTETDATLIVSHGPLTGGALLTHNLAVKNRSHVLHIDLLVHGVREAVEITRRWLVETKCETLNVAGPRASEDPAIYENVLIFLRLLLEH
jgi:Circularly permutated YpsA SLOG family